MRALKILTVVMGVMIVVGVVALGVIMTQRLGGLVAGGAADTVLAEPDGTVIAGIAGAADRIAIRPGSADDDLGFRFCLRSIEPGQVTGSPAAILNSGSSA